MFQRSRSVNQEMSFDVWFGGTSGHAQKFVLSLAGRAGPGFACASRALLLHFLLHYSPPEIVPSAMPMETVMAQQAGDGRAGPRQQQCGISSAAGGVDIRRLYWRTWGGAGAGNCRVRLYYL
jgi:hypothetical protein